MRPSVAAVTVCGVERSAVLRARPSGPLRLLCPRRPGRAAWVVTGNLGGGLVDGDDLALEVTVEHGATCVVTTQASTKVYRGETRQRMAVQVHRAGAAILAPDPIVPFRGARFAQTTAIELDAGASLVLLDTITAGRVAHGERWSAARIDTALDISIDRAANAHRAASTAIEVPPLRDRASQIAGPLRLCDRLVLDGDVAARMRRFDALATCVVVGPQVADLAEAQLARLERPTPGAALVVAGSRFADGAVFRIAGERVEQVTAAARQMIGEACRRLGALPWQRRW